MCKYFLLLFNILYYFYSLFQRDNPGEDVEIAVSTNIPRTYRKPKPMTATAGMDKTRGDAADAASSSANPKPPRAPSPPYMEDTHHYSLGQLTVGSVDSLNTNNENTTIVEITSDSEDEETAATIQTTSKPVAQPDFKNVKVKKEKLDETIAAFTTQSNNTPKIHWPRTQTLL